MNEIIIIHWRDLEVSWIPNTNDFFVMAEIPHQWKQYVKENELLDHCERIAWDLSQDNPANYQQTKEDV